MPARAESIPHSLRSFLKAVSPPIIIDAVRAVRKIGQPAPGPEISTEMLHDAEFYRPHFAPWTGLGEFKDVMAGVAPYSSASAERVWVLYSLAQQARRIPGDFFECGVFQGGTASALARVVRSVEGKTLHLFDTFAGMPDGSQEHDYYKSGIFSDTNLDVVKRVVGGEDHVEFHVGLIPETFRNLQCDRIALAHVDVVLYQSVLDCCSFIYPRLSPGGFMIFDDYGFRTCPGARAAVDEYFADKPERLLVLPTRQGIIIKLCN